MNPITSVTPDGKTLVHNRYLRLRLAYPAGCPIHPEGGGYKMYSPAMVESEDPERIAWCLGYAGHHGAKILSLDMVMTRETTISLPPHDQVLFSVEVPPELRWDGE